MKKDDRNYKVKSEYNKDIGKTKKQGASSNSSNSGKKILDKEALHKQRMKEERAKIKQEKKKEKKRRKKKSHIMQVIEKSEGKPKALVVMWFIGALFLDILRTIKNFVLALLFVLLILGAMGSVAGFVIISPILTEYMEFADNAVGSSTEDTFRISESSYIYDDSGDIITKLRADQDSSYLEYEDIPQYVIDAFVAVEDNSFWDNPGFDIRGIIRVGLDFIQSKGENVTGASTITQQLARNIFLTHEVSIERKAKEILIAVRLTQKYTKEQIMEFYVNDICYANAFYGIDAAANGYFNKSTDELSLSQIAYLCAIPNSPTYYDPYKNPERAVERRDKILGDMLELGYIDQNEYDEAVAEEIVIEKPTYKGNDYATTYAIDCAVRILMKRNGFEFEYVFKTNEDYVNYKKDYDEAYDTAKDQLYSGGYNIYTTINIDRQNEMQTVLDETLAFDEEVNEETGIYALQGAMTVIDNSTGKVIAIIGGRSQEENTTMGLNRAFQSYRQPGSSIKPLIVYTPALENGYTPDSVLKNIDVDKAKDPDVDATELSGSNITMRDAVKKSRNGAAWWLFCSITPEVGMSYITDMEFSNITKDDYYPASSLGGFTYGVTTVEMASAYAALANEGAFRSPNCISSIIDSNGKDIYREKEAIQVYGENAANNMVDMLKDVITSGTASSMKWSRSSDIEAAGKTGTTNESKDGWFCGITPYYSIAVWVGYDQPRELSSLYGSSYPAEIWKGAMLDMLDSTDIGTVPKTFAVAKELEESTGDETYLPGRSDNEVLSPGYTVGNYRSDHALADDVQNYINQMVLLDRNASNYQELKTNLYNMAMTIVDRIYGQTLKAETIQKLQNAYNS